MLHIQHCWDTETTYTAKEKVEEILGEVDATEEAL